MTLEQALLPESELEELLVARTGNDGVEPSRQRVLAELDSLRSTAVAIEPQLDGPWQKTRANIDRAFDAFGQKLSKALARSDETTRLRLDALRSACLPGGTPQERTLSTAHFALEYGPAFATAVWEQMDPDSDKIQIIDPREGSQ